MYICIYICIYIYIYMFYSRANAQLVAYTIRLYTFTAHIMLSIREPLVRVSRRVE